LNSLFSQIMKAVSFSVFSIYLFIYVLTFCLVAGLSHVGPRVIVSIF